MRFIARGRLRMNKEVSELLQNLEEIILDYEGKIEELNNVIEIKDQQIEDLRNHFYS